MIILHDFSISLEEYANREKMNNFPIFDKCPNCDCDCITSGNLHRHGYYWRYAITDEVEFKIPIRIRGRTLRDVPSALVDQSPSRMRTLSDP